MIAPLGGALQHCGHLVNQDITDGGLVDHLHHIGLRHVLHLGADLPIGQWLTRALLLLLNLSSKRRA